MTRPRRVAELLSSPQSALAELTRGAERQQRLDALLATFLDRPLLEHVHAATIDGDSLVLCADDPVWGHRIRYLTPALLEHLRAHGEAGLRDARIVVRPSREAPRSAPPPPGRLEISRRSSALLERVAASLDHPALEKVLARIVRRAR